MQKIYFKKDKYVHSCKNEKYNFISFFSNEIANENA